MINVREHDFLREKKFQTAALREVVPLKVNFCEKYEKRRWQQRFYQSEIIAWR